ncbi:MAG: hypothetical protein M3458_22730 [Acidobacteriota bacterium]|nr:hypothetical protein [Acidobacteriota bacterium]
MNSPHTTKIYYVAAVLALFFSLTVAHPAGVSAQQQQSASTQNLRRATGPLSSTAPLGAFVDPFTAIESEIEAGTTLDLKFAPTGLAPKASAKAEVSLQGQTLLVRMRAKNIPQPSSFDVPRYALWVYVPNHNVKLYIGDLPISSDSNGRGSSESAYRYTALPPGSIFGGLMLTAEPVRYERIVTEALRPVLVGLLPNVDPKNVGSALTVYAGSVPLATVRVDSNEDNNNVPVADKPAPTRPAGKNEPTKKPKETPRRKYE